MCYLEDVYHTKCGHWSDVPRIYHRCAAGTLTQSGVSCFNRKSCGSSSEDTHCKRCRLDMSSTVNQRGMYMSVTRDPQRNCVKVVMGNSKNSGRQKIATQSRLPQGFSHWQTEMSRDLWPEKKGSKLYKLTSRIAQQLANNVVFRRT